MRFFSSVLVACIAIASVIALPAVDVDERSASLATRGTPSVTGLNNGYFYYFYTSGAGDVTYTNLNNGSYEVDWSGDGDFIAGKGWNPGSAQYAYCLLSFLEQF
jgi:endo-1,4-beta-xylanase